MVPSQSLGFLNTNFRCFYFIKFMAQEIPKTYDQSKEPEIYKIWELSGYFNPDNLSGKPYTITMPPPNATGTLHIGHAFEHTIQDIMIRYKRMTGAKALWVPGTDH